MRTIEALDEVQFPIDGFLREIPSDRLEAEIHQHSKDCRSARHFTRALTSPVVGWELVRVRLQQPFLDRGFVLRVEGRPEYLRGENECEALRMSRPASPREVRPEGLRAAGGSPNAQWRPSRRTAGPDPDNHPNTPPLPLSFPLQAPFSIVESPQRDGHSSRSKRSDPCYQWEPSPRRPPEGESQSGRHGDATMESTHPTSAGTIPHNALAYPSSSAAT